jgi:hypothetical protein
MRYFRHKRAVAYLALGLRSPHREVRAKTTQFLLAMAPEMSRKDKVLIVAKALPYLREEREKPRRLDKAHSEVIGNLKNLICQVIGIQAESLSTGDFLKAARN